MNKTALLLAATTALTATLALPAIGAQRGFVPSSDVTLAVLQDDNTAAHIWLASDDDDDDDDDHRKRRRKGHDDDDHHGHDDDDDDDDHGRSNRRMKNQSATPPKNGLFGNGAKPQVKMN